MFDFPSDQELEEAAMSLLVSSFVAYSAWLESEGLLKKPKKRDGRTHEDLVNQFLDGCDEVSRSQKLHAEPLG